MVEGEPGGGDLNGIALAADGRILMSRVSIAAAGDAARMILLQNWPAAVRR